MGPRQTAGDDDRRAGEFERGGVEGPGGEPLLVYLGGGTFDASLVEI